MHGKIHTHNMVYGFPCLKKQVFYLAWTKTQRDVSIFTNSDVVVIKGIIFGSLIKIEQKGAKKMSALHA